ncbi:MAG: DUF3429 domain-containing protein [Gammaproteobacteria bacterium]
MNNDPQIPTLPLRLGAGGLVPFIVFAGSLWAAPLDYRPLLVGWLSTYAAVILSFIGALHWGIAMVHRNMIEGDRALFMTWSVVPAIAAWVALLLPETSRFMVLAAAFAVDYAVDRELVRRYPITPWFLRLRGGLTAVVVPCLLLAALRVFLT